MVPGRNMSFGVIGCLPGKDQSSFYFFDRKVVDSLNPKPETLNPGIEKFGGSRALNMARYMRRNNDAKQNTSG